MRRLRSIPLAAMLCVALVRLAAAELSPHAVADTSEMGQSTRALVEASRAETLALLIGRRSAKRWDVVLDETLYRLAPRGAWGPDHPAWKPARAALTIEPRALPYRLTVVMIEPTVVVMRFDLGSLVGLPAPRNAPTIGTPWLEQGVEYGTRFPATGTLLWFSPDAKQEPMPVAMSGDDRGEIVAQGKRLVLDRRGGTWQVTVPSR